jgi:hypothetical protein
LGRRQTIAERALLSHTGTVAHRLLRPPTRAPRPAIRLS